MPVIDSNGCPIDVEVSGPADAPVLMLSSSLGTTKHMWDPQMPAFSAKYRVVRYDRRGHGKSGVPKGEYNMVGSSRVDLQACKLEYSIVSPK